MKNQEIKQEIQATADRLVKELTDKLCKEESFLPNRWYKQNSGAYGFDLKVGKNNFGFRKGGDTYRDNLAVSETGQSWKLVTDYTELDKLLWEELSNRKYQKGTIVTGVVNSPTEIMFGKFTLSENRNNIIFGGVTIFNDGKWAEIVKEPTIEDWLLEAIPEEHLQRALQFFKENNLKIVKA